MVDVSSKINIWSHSKVKTHQKIEWLSFWIFLESQTSLQLITKMMCLPFYWNSDHFDADDVNDNVAAGIYIQVFEIIALYCTRTSLPLPWASVHWLVQCTLRCHWNATVWPSEHWVTKQILAGYTGTPLEKLSWSCPHCNTTGKTLLQPMGYNSPHTYTHTDRGTHI